MNQGITRKEQISFPEVKWNRQNQNWKKFLSLLLCLSFLVSLSLSLLSVPVPLVIEWRRACKSFERGAFKRSHFFMSRHKNTRRWCLFKKTSHLPRQRGEKQKEGGGGDKAASTSLESQLLVLMDFNCIYPQTHRDSFPMRHCRLFM